MENIQFKRTNSNDPDFQSLIILLDNNLREINGEIQAAYDGYNLLDYIETVVIACQDNAAVACGCFKKFDGDTIEIKRMFTLAPYRGKGIAATIVKELETWAKELGYTHSVLETGKKHHDAIYLYQKLGYSITEKYEPYLDMEESVCMRKVLV